MVIVHCKTVVLLATVLLLGCTQSGQTLLGDMVPVEDTGFGGTSADLDSGGERGVDAIRFEEISDFRLQEQVSFDESSGCEPGAGCFLEPCEDSKDCAYGYCVMHLGDKVCSKTCLEECPDGFECAQLAAAAPDVVFICASRFASLCFPCTDDGECKEMAGTGSSCIDYGMEGHFCGAVCGEDDDCPMGFGCEQVATIDGLLTAQCVADSGSCPCTEHAVKSGAATLCVRENPFGLCKGGRSCTAEGLTACAAAVPSAEICDGADNNCDGDVDEVSCDDGNPCTGDSCLGEGGCENVPATGGECLDGDACTIGDHCQEGECVGSPLNCGDNNPCTDDSCDPALGCHYDFNTAGCDDGDPCSFGDVCLAGNCVGLPGLCECQSDADCLELADGNKCLGEWYCNKAETPFNCVKVPGTAVECEAPAGPDKHCFINVCVPISGECAAQPANQSGPCDDGDACTSADACLDGECIPGVSPNCNDGSACTDDWCEPKVGCMHVNNAVPCTDGSACTVGDACSKGECVPGGVADCDDGNVCTDDLCNVVEGCQHVANSADCNDGDSCTLGDKCSNGWCVPGGGPDCNDGNVCTDDDCGPDGQCVNLANELLCSDDDPCTVGDHCVLGGCVSGTVQSCDDGNVCTDDSCNDQGLCLHVPNVAACDDENLCTTGDTCSLGKCVAAGVQACDDENPCTTDACDPQVGCTYALNSLACDDGDICTVGDLCQLGECKPGLAMNCDDTNPCTDDLCDPGVGCEFVPAAGECDDGNECTLGDGCGGGQCVSGEVLECDDGNACTKDTCSKLTGCVNSPADLPCSDGNACTTGDVCVEGQCIGGGTPDCDDGNLCTDDACDGLVGCMHENNVVACDDGDACTVGDLCTGGECVPGEASDCDDQNICTDDSCDPLGGCVNDHNTKECTDGNACTVGDKCSGGQCVPGAAPDCDDSDVCTTDSCDEDVGCVNDDVVPCCSNGQVEAGEQCDDGNLATGDGCDADCQEENGMCHNGSTVDCNPAGTTLNANSRFVDPDPPAGWVQCAGFINTSGNDVNTHFLDNCLNTTRMRVRAWNVGSGQLEEDVYVGNMQSWSQWPNWNYLGGNMTKVKSTYWTGNTEYFTCYNGNDACSLQCCTSAPANTLTLGTGNGNSIIFAPGNTNALEWRVSCGGSALPGRRVAVYR